MIELKEMESGDLDECLNIDKERFIISPYSLKSFQICLNSPSEKVITLKKDGILIGYVMFSLVLDEGEIYRIAVTKDEEGKGYGKTLLDSAHSYLKSKGAATCFLEVRRSNIRAKNLYEKNGYLTYRVRKNYYENGEDAFCMKKGL